MANNKQAKILPAPNFALVRVSVEAKTYGAHMDKAMKRQNAFAFLLIMMVYNVKTTEIRVGI